MMLKRIIALFCLTVLCLSAFCACAAKKQTADETATTAAEEPIDFSEWSEAECLAFAEERGVYPPASDGPNWGALAKNMMTTGGATGLTMGRPDILQFESAVYQMMRDYYQEFDLNWQEHLMANYNQESGVNWQEYLRSATPEETEQQTAQP